jgi:hypothetical protein
VTRRKTWRQKKVATIVHHGKSHNFRKALDTIPAAFSLAKEMSISYRRVLKDS